MPTTRFALALAFVLPSCAGPRETARPLDVREHAVPLVTTREDGVADTQVVPIRFEGRAAWLALDTGAQFTFLYSRIFGEKYVERAGDVELGGERLNLPGYRDDAIGVEEFRDASIVGLLGLDWFDDVPTALDYPRGRIVQYRGGALPPEDERLPAIPLRGGEHGRALVDVVLDGETLTLMLDTGAHDTLLIDCDLPAQAEAGVQTADGSIWPVHVAERTLALPGEPPRTITVLRAGDLAYIAPELRELGADGLLGLTALGWRRIVFDFDGGAVRLGPLEEAR